MGCRGCRSFAGQLCDLASRSGRSGLSRATREAASLAVMATPQFILDLRRHIGHAPLWLAGSSAVVVRDGPRGPQVLLVQRADDGEWTPVCGIIEPGGEA